MELAGLFVRKMLAEAGSEEERERIRALVFPEGLPPNYTETLIPAAPYYALLEALAEREAPAIGFHMRTCGAVRCEDFGAVGLAWKTAPTLRRSFERMDRYVQLFNRVSAFALEDHGDEAWWTHRRTSPDRRGMYLSNEGALATFVTIWREARNERVAPRRVQLAHEPLGSLAALEAHFECPVEYGAATDAIVFSKAQLDHPNRVGDETVWNFFRTHLSALPDKAGTEKEDAAAAADMPAQVRHQVAAVLSEGPPRLEQIAAELGLGARTLQRRLDAAGSSFQTEVARARRDLAMRLVGEARRPLAEVAFLTGFAEQSSFTRAFRRWAGVSPGRYRQDLRTQSETRGPGVRG